MNNVYYLQWLYLLPNVHAYTLYNNTENNNNNNVT